MGRSYWFECVKCGYRAKVSGQADQGLDVCVQTILCRDCRQLYDAVVRWRVGLESWPEQEAKSLGLRRPRLLTLAQPSGRAPAFGAVLGRLPIAGSKRFRWLEFPPQCPVSALHRIRPWNQPDKCPRCGLYLERNALPYRIWE